MDDLFSLICTLAEREGWIAEPELVHISIPGNPVIIVSVNISSDPVQLRVSTGMYTCPFLEEALEGAGIAYDTESGILELTYDLELAELENQLVAAINWLSSLMASLPKDAEQAIEKLTERLNALKSRTNF